MGRDAFSPRDIDISEIDLHFANIVQEIVKQGGAACFSARINLMPREGTASIHEVSPYDISSGAATNSDGVDFDLSPSSCAEIDDVNLDDYIDKPLVTSSAYELFEFLGNFCTSIACLVEFTGSAWRITVREARSG